MAKLNRDIVHNLITEEKLSKLLKVFEVREYDYTDIQMKQYNSSTIWGKDELTGAGFKRFFRYNGSCFDDIKQELLSNQNSSYITYFNNIAKEGIVPEWVSVLAKKSDMFRAYREIITSQILNYCGVPTCANISIYDKNQKFERTLVSVDFISENERFLNSEDMKLKYKEYSLESWLSVLSKALDKMKIIKRKPELKEKIIKDFVYSFIVRRGLLGDTDCQTWNMGLLINEKDGYLKLINFDYEYGCRNAQMIYGTERDIEFARKYFPEEYAKLMQKVDEFGQVLPSVKLKDEMVYNSLVKNVDYMKTLSQPTM